MDPLSDPQSSDNGPTGAGHDGLAKSTVMGAIVAIAFTGAAIFLMMKMLGAQDNTATLRAEMVTLAESETTLRSELDVHQARLRELNTRSDVLWEGKLSVCNESERTATIAVLTATYMKNGQFETFNSEIHGLNHWVLEPGERQVLSFAQRDVTWDGSAVFYAIHWKAGGLDYFYAGRPQSTEGWCVALREG